jgi:hypothetical protein
MIAFRTASGAATRRNGSQLPPVPRISSEP